LFGTNLRYEPGAVIQADKNVRVIPRGYVDPVKAFDAAIRVGLKDGREGPPMAIYEVQPISGEPVQLSRGSVVLESGKFKIKRRIWKRELEDEHKLGRVLRVGLIPRIRRLGLQKAAREGTPRKLVPPLQKVIVSKETGGEPVSDKTEINELRKEFARNIAFRRSMSPF
jgi:hypothetical protein